MAAPESHDQTVLSGLVSAMAHGDVSTVDLTHTLDPDFPVIILPPEFGQCARFRMEEISAYDHRGPAWKWHNFSCCEHTGTHFDAPSHWISGRDLPNNSVDEIPVGRFIGPACVIDCSAGAGQDDALHRGSRFHGSGERRTGLRPYPVHELVELMATRRPNSRDRGVMKWCVEMLEGVPEPVRACHGNPPCPWVHLVGPERLDKRS